MFTFSHSRYSSASFSFSSDIFRIVFSFFENHVLVPACLKMRTLQQWCLTTVVEAVRHCQDHTQDAFDLSTLPDCLYEKILFECLPHLNDFNLRCFLSSTVQVRICYLSPFAHLERLGTQSIRMRGAFINIVASDKPELFAITMSQPIEM